MGNYVCCAEKDFELTNKTSDWVHCIESSNMKSLKQLIIQLPTRSLSINDRIIQIGSFSLSPLSYSLLSGNFKVFKQLLAHGACLKEMDQNLSSYDLSVISIICEKNYLELLEYYFPIYIHSLERSMCSSEKIETTLNLGNTLEPIITNFSTPIQKACEKGNISIVMYIYKYFKDKNVPRTFDINYPNEKTGENCALIACRKGNFGMVKFLYENCGADFFQLNRYEENAIIISVCGYRFNKQGEYLRIIKYLIEKIGIDLKYMHEEVLMLSDCEELTNYLEDWLSKLEIFVTKEEVDLKYGVKKRLCRESFESNSGNDFFNSIIRRYLDENENKSQISSISCIESKTDLSIFSS